MNSDSVDLIYLDPPFNSNKTYSAPIGSKAAGAAFKDSWTLDDVDVAWIGLIAEKEPCLSHLMDTAGIVHGKGMKAYLVMMAVRLLEMRRLLRRTGSIYLHCDPTASHYLKLVGDCVFGTGAFQNEVVWGYRTGGISKRRWPRKHDVLLFYANPRYKHSPIQERIFYEKPFFTSKTDAQGRYYADVYVRDVWDDVRAVINTSKGRTGYPTQKPLKLLERIVEASSDEGDTVLDPFCGCATTCVAAERLDREWVGIDISPKAVELVKVRMERETSLLDRFNPIARTDIPQRTDVCGLPPYKTHKHTLYGQQEGRCRGCKHHFPFQNFTVDHVVARSKGGTDHIDNLQLLCNHCNSVKGTMDQAAFVAKLKAQGIGN